MMYCPQNGMVELIIVIVLKVSIKIDERNKCCCWLHSCFLFLIFYLSLLFLIPNRETSWIFETVVLLCTATQGWKSITPGVSQYNE